MTLCIDTDGQDAHCPGVLQSRAPKEFTLVKAKAADFPAMFFGFCH